MKDLVIFHYHFLPGGVTDVVVSAVQSYLQYSSVINNITIVSGRADNLDEVEAKIAGSLTDGNKRRFSVQLLREIDYAERIDDKTSPDILGKMLIDRFGNEENIWWVHNYHLGKNPFFTAALLDISQKTDQKMVFHIHDFPECSRYRLLNSLKEVIKEDLYSHSPSIRYAVINSRDYQNLISAGLSKDRVFLLENPLKISSEDFAGSKETSLKLSRYFGNRFPGWKKDEDYMLYPVRAIRRKNIGEAAFLSILADKNIIVSLPGVSHMERSYSQKCSGIFTSGLAPGMFGIGYEIEEAGVSFHELISSSSIICSSSVQEGFGYLFLNSINWGKPLVARDLDMLESFKPAFSRYKAHFYSDLNIPKSDIPDDALLRKYKEKITALENVLSRSARERLASHFENMCRSGTVDFSYLPLSLQIDIIKRAISDRSFIDHCIDINKTLIEKINRYFFADCSHRRNLLEEKWSYETYSRSTDEILRSFSAPVSLAEPPKAPKTVYESIVANFANPAYLRLLYDD